jgi:hypothetical protein
LLNDEGNQNSAQLNVVFQFQGRHLFLHRGFNVTVRLCTKWLPVGHM